MVTIREWLTLILGVRWKMLEMARNKLKATVWNSMLDADLNSRYWGYLGKRYYNFDWYSKVILSIVSVVGVVSWLFVKEALVYWRIISIIFAIVAVPLPFLDWPKKIEVMATLKRKWTELKHDYELFRVKVDDIENDVNSLLKEFRLIQEKELELAALDSHLPTDKKVVMTCWKEVVQSRFYNNGD